MSKLKSAATLLLVAVIMMLPILVNPNLFVYRGNDLQEFFLPIYLYVKQHIHIYQELPLWNTMFLSGVPLLPDPQAPLFYLPNIIFLFLPIETSFIVSSLLHIALGGIGMYLLAKQAFKFNDKFALLAGSLYIIAPRLSAFFEAGHFGLIAATAWIPYVALFTYQLIIDTKPKTAVWLALALAAIFFTHPTTFVLLSGLVGIAFTLNSLVIFKDARWGIMNIKNITPIITMFIACLFTFGLVAIALLPQLEWVPETNRFLLSTDRQVWPKWLSIGEFVKAVTNPLIFGKDFAYSLDTEKWIALGIFPLVLAFYGWLKSDKKQKMLSFLLGGIILTMAMNTVSPLYSFLISQDWYVYARVSTRSWFVITILVILFTTHAIRIISSKHKNLSYVLVFVVLTETLTLSWTYITQPLTNDRQVATENVYEYSKSDEDEFRVFCTTRCFSQADVARYNIQTVGGYSTLHQKNYYQHAWLLTGTYWDYYTLALPPIGSYKFDQLDPDFASLGEYNTKYVISPHELDDPYAKLETTIDGYFIYSNDRYKPRVYTYDENNNFIPIKYERMSSHELHIFPEEENTLTVSEVYTKGWNAYTDNGVNVPVREQTNALISLTLPENTNTVILLYSPNNYTYGKLITGITILSFGVVLWKTKKK